MLYKFSKDNLTKQIYSTAKNDYKDFTNMLKNTNYNFEYLKSNVVLRELDTNIYDTDYNSLTFTLKNINNKVKIIKISVFDLHNNNFLCFMRVIK